MRGVPHHIAAGHTGIGHAARIKSDEGIMREEHAPGVGIGGLNGIAVAGLGLVFVGGIPELRGFPGNGARRRAKRKHVGDHGLVESRDLHAHVKAMVRAPVPVKPVVAGVGEPVPVHVLPKLGDAGAQGAFLLTVLRKVSPGDEQALHEEGRFHEIGAVVLFPEGNGLARAPVQPVRESAMEILPV